MSVRPVCEHTFVARIYRVTIKGHYSNGALLEPSLHYQTDVPDLGEEPEPNDVASGVWTLLGTAFKNLQNNSTVIDEVIAAEEVLKPDIGVAGTHVVGQNGTATATAPDISHGLSAVINLHTATRSRSARGWCKVGCDLVHSSIVGDNWAAAYKATLDAFAALMDNTFELGTLQITTVRPVIYSKTRREKGFSPYAFHVTSGTANPQVRWQRSRLSVP